MKYKTKPVEIEAEEFTLENKDRAFNFITCNHAPAWDDEGNPTILSLKRKKNRQN